MSTPNEPTQPDPFGPDGPELPQTFSEPVANGPAANPAAAPHVPEREPEPPTTPEPPVPPAPPAPPVPPHVAQQQYAQPAATAPNAMPNTWMNIVALVTALLGMAIIPVIFGHLGVSQANKGRADLKGLGIAGLILGYLEIVGWIVLIIGLVAWSRTVPAN